MRRGEGRTLALFEDSVAAAVGIRERAFWIMHNVQEPEGTLEVVEKAAIIHEYAKWWCDKVEEVKSIWQSNGRPDIYTNLIQGSFME